MKVLKGIIICICIIVILFVGGEFLRRHIMKSTDSNSDPIDFSWIKTDARFDKESILGGMFVILCFY